MIKISIKKDEITISGHSGYGEEGTDIVCASVSSICITTVNAILSINEEAIDYTESDGFLNIKIKKTDDVINKLINNMINLLKELEKQYKNYIEIR